jgi:regulator of sigma E protease
LLITLGSFIVVIGVIIFVHELGHFIAAKLTGVRVEVFSLGFMHKIVSKKIGDTEYAISWLPLGGYVKMTGMIDESLEDKPLTGAPYEFMSKKFPQKLFILSAGVLMNLLLGILVFFSLTWMIGLGEIKYPLVGSVEADFPAAQAGIQSGDRIVFIDGDSIETWEELTGIIHPRLSDTLAIVWQRGDSLYQADLVTKVREIQQGDSTLRFGAIGIGPKSQFHKVGMARSLGQSLRITWFIITQSLKILGMLIFGQASFNEVAGPIGIAQLSGQTFRSGFVDFLAFLAQVSIGIGLLNILPFPVVDGGHIVLAGIEAVIRRPISSKIKLNVWRVGWALLIAFFLLVSYHDVLRVFFK